MTPLYCPSPPKQIARNITCMTLPFLMGSTKFCGIISANVCQTEKSFTLGVLGFCGASSTSRALRINDKSSENHSCPHAMLKTLIVNIMTTVTTAKRRPNFPTSVASDIRVSPDRIEKNVNGATSMFRNCRNIFRTLDESRCAVMTTVFTRLLYV